MRPSPRIVAALAVLVAGVLVWQGSTAAFTATTRNAGNSWASLFLGRDLGAPAALAATGYIALVGSQFIGRLLGDGLVDRFGQAAAIVNDHQQVLEVVQVECRVDEGGLDDRVRVAVDVDDLADE